MVEFAEATPPLEYSHRWITPAKKKYHSDTWEEEKHCSRCGCVRLQSSYSVGDRKYKSYMYIRGGRTESRADLIPCFDPEIEGEKTID